MEGLLSFKSEHSSNEAYQANMTYPDTPVRPAYSLEADFPWLVPSSVSSLDNLEAGIDSQSLISTPLTNGSFVGLLQDTLDMFASSPVKSPFNIGSINMKQDETRPSVCVSPPENSSPQRPPPPPAHEIHSLQTDLISAYKREIESPGSSRRSSSSSGFYSMTSPDSSDIDVEKSPNSSKSCSEVSSVSCIQTPEDIITIDLTSPQSVSSKSASPPPSTNTSPISKPVDNSKPSASYVELIARALLTGTNYRMILADIYAYILQHYPYYETARSTWRNAVRHNLCVNDCFIKAGRSNSGRGFFWAIHPACVDMFKKGDFRRYQARKLAQAIPPPSATRNQCKSNYGTTANVHIIRAPNNSHYMLPSNVTVSTAAPPNVYIRQSMCSTAGAYKAQVMMPYQQQSSVIPVQLNGSYKISPSYYQQQQPTSYYSQYYTPVSHSRMTTVTNGHQGMYQ